MLGSAATFPGSQLTCIAAPAQQRSAGPEHRSGPDAEEGHTDGVHAEAVGCTQTWRTVSGLWKG